MSDKSGNSKLMFPPGINWAATRPSLAMQAALAALVVCLQFVLPAGAAPKPARNYAVDKKVYDLCRLSDALIDAKSYDQARTLLVGAARLDPNSYSAYVHSALASCYRGLGQSKQALKEIELSIKFDPDHEEALYNAAITYFNLQHFDTALHHLKKLMQISTNPGWKARAQKLIDEIEVYSPVNEASKCLNSGQYQKAIKLLSKAAARDPSPFSGSIHGNLAYALRNSGNPEKAILEGKKALSFNPGDKTTVYTVALSYQDIGKFDQAISWLRRYVSMESDSNLRNKANAFIQDLADDRSKVDPKASDTPDYFNLLKENDGIYRWPKKKLPIKVYIGPGKGVTGYRSNFDEFIPKSMDRWCEDSGKKLNYVIVDKLQKSDINVIWQSGPIVLHENNRSRQKQGLATYELDGSGKLAHVKVQVRTVNGFDASRKVEPGACASVCMHELGHALGLGHSTCVSDVMYFSSSSKQTGFPSKRDKATIALLYNDYPVVAFVPQAPVSTTKVKHLPPPAFVPPKLPDASKLKPPLFIPPPVKTLDERLPPPLFVPPPVSPGKKDSVIKKEPKNPMFIPPPVKNKKNKDAARPPFFTPPPVK